jgi:hypothetical protein
MKKLLLSVFTIVSSLSMAQDFSTYCSVADFTASTLGQFGIDNKAFISTSFEAGALMVSKKDTLGEANITFNVPNLVGGGIPINGSIFRFKIKSTYTATVRIKVVNDGFGKTYDVPFVSNKTIIGGADFFDYELDVSGPLFNQEKFQQVIIVVANTESTTGTVTIKDFNYGGIECGSFAPNSTMDTKSNLYFTKAYPNPASESINVSATTKENTKVKISLINTLGNEVYAHSETSANYAHSINTTTLAKGVYQLVYSLNDVVAKSEIVIVK